VALAPGIRLGAYEILTLIGVGGMGEVYRATDTKLHRDVAIKVLPSEVAADPDRLARFEREAQVLASLNHPNIAHIHGVDESAGVPALIMELVEGPTLADRIAKGPIPLDEALPIAKQIAEALEAAHEQGIIHRDLKPANIKVRPDGTVKVLDFGLAKAFDPVGSVAGNATMSPTLSIHATQAGLILGTAAYMSPEQAAGKAVDRRCDVWAFAVVLFEMLTGRRLFEGETVSHTLADVLRAPIDLSALPVNTPATVRQLLSRCLDRDVKTRLRDMGEARIVLARPIAEPVVHRRTDARSNKLLWVAVLLLGSVSLTLGALLWRATRPAPLKPLARLSVDLGPNAVLGVGTTVAISHDGTRIVFPVRGDDGRQRLATRLLDQSKETPLTGTDDGRYPFFSPDGQWVGFFAEGKLRKVSVLGGASVTLCDASSPRGASWGEDGAIVVAPSVAGGLFRVPESGGKPEALTKSSVLSHRWPQRLPRGRGVVFTATQSNSNQEGATIEVLDAETGAIKNLVQDAYYGRVLAGGERNGYLLYVHTGTLFAAPLDLDRLELRGPPTPMLEDIAADVVSGTAQLEFSDGGTVIYLSGTSDVGVTARWLEADGTTQSLLPPGQYGPPHFSPDGRGLALPINSGSTREIHVYDVERQNLRQLTFARGVANYPIWAPDGKHLAFSLAGRIEWIRADGVGQPQHLVQGSSTTINPYSFSPDGRRLSYYQVSTEGSNADIWTVPLDLTDPDHPKPGPPEPFLRTSFNEGRGAFSPDGRWMAYESNESGTTQIYVQPFPGPGGKWQVSNMGGRFPFWSPDRKHLFFETLDGYLMVADYTMTSDSFVPGKARRWSNVQLRGDVGGLNMALHPDGKRFVIFPAAKSEEKGDLQAIFLLNFTDELTRRTPTKAK
jgi:serine/threonine-protein kinase